MNNTLKWLGCMLVLVQAAMFIQPARSAEMETSPSSVAHLPIDDEARESLEELVRLERAGKWREIIDLCQRYIARPPKGVVELQKGIYGSVQTLCERRLADLPESRLVLYRDLHDPRAEKLLQLALEERDLNAARRVVAEFRLTSHGPRAVALLGDLLFERGDMPGAMQQWRSWATMVRMDTIPEAERRRLAAKSAIAAARVGNAEALQWAITLFGDRGSVVQVGEQKIARGEELLAAAQAFWREVGSSLVAAPSTFNFVPWTQMYADRYAGGQDEYRGSPSRNLFYTIDAQILGNRLFVISADGARCLDLITGRPIWHRTERNYDTDHYSAMRSLNFHVRVCPDASDTSQATVFLSGGPRLMAVSADTGRLIWSQTAASLARAAEIVGDRELRVAFSSPVVCRGGRAFGMVETSRGEVFLLAFNRSNGRSEWLARIGGSAPKSNYRLSFPSDLAILGDDLVFTNGHGMIGRCNANSGEIRWMVPYRRRSDLVAEGFYNLPTGVDYSPMAINGGRVFCMPGDSAQLIALDLADGREVWSQPSTGRLTGVLPRDKDADYARLITSGENIECRRDDTGELLWTWPVPEPVKGVGRVTIAGVVVATPKGIYRIDPKAGELLSFAPINVQGVYGVSVAAGADVLALVTEQQVVTAGGRDRIEKIVSEQLKERDADPHLIAVSARVLADAGRAEEASARLEEAVQAARRTAGRNQTAEALERELIEMHHRIFLSEWEAGRRRAAFDRLRKALHTSGRTPYECRVGYRSEAEADAGPHRVRMASGDTLSGQLIEVDAKSLSLGIGEDTWAVNLVGVDRLVVTDDIPDVDRDAVGGRRLFPVNGDRVSFEALTYKAQKFEVKTGAGVLNYPLSDVAAVTFGGQVFDVADNTVYLRLRNGDQLSGTIEGFDGSTLALDIPQIGRRSIAIDAVHTIGNRRQMPEQGVDVEPLTIKVGGPNWQQGEAAEVFEDPDPAPEE